jgi:TRAP-type C4-dicarboxylate transport system permease small subunit
MGSSPSRGTFPRSPRLVKRRAALTIARACRYDPRAVTALLRVLRSLPHVAVTVLMLVAMTDMLIGVFLRYVVTWVSARFDLPSVRFFWVEEIGEYSLAWLTFIGAAIGIARGTHFAVHIVTDRLPWPVRRAIAFGQHALLIAFGALLAVFGWQVSELNSQSYSPALDLNLRSLYLSSVVGGVLIIVYSAAGLLDVLRAPKPPAAAS